MKTLEKALHRSIMVRMESYRHTINAVNTSYVVIG